MGISNLWDERVDTGKIGGVKVASEHEACQCRALIVLRAVFVVIGLPIAWAMLIPQVPLPTLQAAMVVVGGTLMYVALAYLIDPAPDMDNLGPAAGMIDDPWRYSDNVNRWLMSLKCLLGPGRFVAESVFDVRELFADAEETEEDAVQS